MSLQHTESVPPPTLSRPARDNAAIERAILQTMAYADVFDYPLTTQEIHQYLIEVATPPDTVQTVLSNGRLVPQHLTHDQGFFVLPGREPIIETRMRRAEAAADLWPRAVRYGLSIAGLPFVRMVAVTGALAMDNVEAGDDFDFLIVTEPDRLWLCRVIIIALVVKPAARRGDVICPNYLLSERALLFGERNLFTAHELMQMVPVAGLETYRHMRQLNAWATRFLPNAGDLPLYAGSNPSFRRPIHTIAETVLRTPLGAWLERWEMKRKVRKLSRQAEDQAGFAFSADQCKGHFDNHGQKILKAFNDRLDGMDARGVLRAA